MADVVPWVSRAVGSSLYIRIGLCEVKFLLATRLPCQGTCLSLNEKTDCQSMCGTLLVFQCNFLKPQHCLGYFVGGNAQLLHIESRHLVTVVIVTNDVLQLLGYAFRLF